MSIAENLELTKKSVDKGSPVWYNNIRRLKNGKRFLKTIQRERERKNSQILKS